MLEHSFSPLILYVAFFFFDGFQADYNFHGIFFFRLAMMIPFSEAQQNFIFHFSFSPTTNIFLGNRTENMNACVRKFPCEKKKETEKTNFKAHVKT